jgi:hypothetical protein
VGTLHEIFVECLDVLQGIALELFPDLPGCRHVTPGRIQGLEDPPDPEVVGTLGDIAPALPDLFPNPPEGLLVPARVKYRSLESREQLFKSIHGGGQTHGRSPDPSGDRPDIRAVTLETPLGLSLGLQAGPGGRQIMLQQSAEPGLVGRLDPSPSGKGHGQAHHFRRSILIQDHVDSSGESSPEDAFRGFLVRPPGMEDHDMGSLGPQIAPRHPGQLRRSDGIESLRHLQDQITLPEELGTSQTMGPGGTFLGPQGLGGLDSLSHILETVTVGWGPSQSCADLKQAANGDVDPSVHRVELEVEEIVSRQPREPGGNRGQEAFLIHQPPLQQGIAATPQESLNQRQSGKVLMFYSGYPKAHGGDSAIHLGRLPDFASWKLLGSGQGRKSRPRGAAEEFHGPLQQGI